MLLCSWLPALLPLLCEVVLLGRGTSKPAQEAFSREGFSLSGRNAEKDNLSLLVSAPDLGHFSALHG